VEGQTDVTRRVAGQYAREVARGLAARAIWIGVGVLGLLALCFFAFGLRGLPLVGVELVAVAAIVLTDRLIEPNFGRWQRGAEGERSVGAVLEGLLENGWHVIHDASLGRGNIDHVAIGPGGVFTIETKSHGGRIGLASIDSGMLSQAYAEKKLVERISGEQVEALLVFSRAYLIGRVPARRRGVTVLPARMLAGYLQRRPQRLSPAQARELDERLAEAFDQREIPAKALASQSA
jgi:Holliday junction resolvase